MTAESFRANGDFRKKLAELLNEPVMQQAFVIIADLGTALEAPLNADPIVSARSLSQQHGWQSALRSFHILTASIEPEAEDIEPDYSAPLSVTTPNP